MKREKKRKKKNVQEARPEPQPKKRVSFLLIFACLMILGGTLTLLYPIVGNYLANRERSEAVSRYDDSLKKLSKKQVEEQFISAQQYNEMIFKKQQGERYEEINYKKVVNENGVMGTLDIPALNIEQMPFYHGTDFRTLDRGLGHFQPTSIPIGGKNTRSVISGHSGLENQVLFTEINALEIGDLFFINILGKRYAYQIESFEEVLPKESDKIKIQAGKDMVTLLTCTPPGINTYRLLVNGVRVPYKEALMKTVKERNTWGYQRVVLSSLSVCLFIGVLLFLRYRYLKKRLRSRKKSERVNARKQLRRLFFVTKAMFVVLILSMITVLAFAIYGYLRVQETQPMEELNVGVNGELSSYNLAKVSRANYTEQDIASVNINNYANAKIAYQQVVNEWGIGKLVLPTVEVHLPILAGLNNENLMNGAATYSKEQQMGKGNYVLLSHNIDEQDVLMHRIATLQTGDEVHLTDFKDVYIYKVTTNKVIKDTEVSVVEKPEAGSKARVTLLRCEGTVGTKFRRLVQGEFVRVASLSTLDAEELKQLGITMSDRQVSETIVSENPIRPIDRMSLTLTAKIISEPLQTILPIFLLLVIPILFLNLIR